MKTFNLPASPSPLDRVCSTPLVNPWTRVGGTAVLNENPQSLPMQSWGWRFLMGSNQPQGAQPAPLIGKGVLYPLSDGLGRGGGGARLLGGPKIK